MVETEKENSGLFTTFSTCPNSTDKKGATKVRENMEKMEYKRLNKRMRKIFFLNGKIYRISLRKSFILFSSMCKNTKIFD
jgi:hypothetical protein